MSLSDYEPTNYSAMKRNQKIQSFEYCKLSKLWNGHSEDKKHVKEKRKRKREELCSEFSQSFSEWNKMIDRLNVKFRENFNTYVFWEGGTMTGVPDKNYKPSSGW